MKTAHIIIGVAYAITGLYLAAKSSNSIFGSSDGTIIVLLFFWTLAFLFVTVGIVYEKVETIEKHLNLPSRRTFLGKDLAETQYMKHNEFSNIKQVDDTLGQLNEEIGTEEAVEWTCYNCNNILDLDPEEIKKRSFVCPVCNHENKLDA